VTVNVISVGISVLDALADPEAKLAGKTEIITAIRRTAPRELMADAGIDEVRGKQEASAWLAAALSPGRSGARDALADAAAAVRPGQWPLNMSAEVETFGVVQRTGGFSLSGGDLAVLVCSDTPPGLLAGAWNALAITGGDLSRVRYVPDIATPGSGLADLHGHAVLVRITGMDASDSKGFQAAMNGLGLLGRSLFASGSLRPAEEFRFYLSGGFKAAIPYLVGLAEAVRSVDVTCLERLGRADLMPGPGPWPVKAFMLHEAAAPGTPPIELPLRRIVARVVRNELTEWENGQRTGVPDQGLLEGYAYEVASGPPGKERCELTAFGAGLRALFGLSREGLGG
jgi:hypothetical protein